LERHVHGFATLEEVADAIAGYRSGAKRTGNLTGLTKNLRRGARVLRITGSTRNACEPGTHLLIRANSPNKKNRHKAGCFVWWRWRESNPRPQALCRRFYMFSRLYCFNRLLPERQGKQTASP